MLQLPTDMHPDVTSRSQSGAARDSAPSSSSRVRRGGPAQPSCSSRPRRIQRLASRSDRPLGHCRAPPDSFPVENKSTRTVRRALTNRRRARSECDVLRAQARARAFASRQGRRPRRTVTVFLLARSPATRRSAPFWWHTSCINGNIEPRKWSTSEILTASPGPRSPSKRVAGGGLADHYQSIDLVGREVGASDSKAVDRSTVPVWQVRLRDRVLWRKPSRVHWICRPLPYRGSAQSWLRIAARASARRMASTFMPPNSEVHR